MSLREIAIVGYGSAGQALALALSRDGHRVQVFEQAAQPGPVGAGFLLQPTGLAAMWELGLLDAALQHGRRIERLYGDVPQGERLRAVMDMRYAGLDARLFGLGLQRGALFEILRAAWPGQGGIVTGTRIVAVSDDGLLRDAEGQLHGPFDLVVAADGSGSVLRAQIGEAVALDQPYPWGALWCLRSEGDWAHPHELRQRYRQARKMIGVLPVGTRPGEATPQISFFWSLPRAAMDDWHQGGLARWRDEVVALWPEVAPLLAGLQETTQLARAQYRDVILRGPWHRGRLVLCGDSAHAMSPQLGQGVNMALLDALALRDALRGGGSLETALARYAARRRRHVGIYQFWSRWLTPIFQSEHDGAAALRDLALLPMGKLPGGRGQMLRVLTGTQQGWLGRFALPAGFLEAIA